MLAQIIITGTLLSVGFVLFAFGCVRVWAKIGEHRYGMFTIILSFMLLAHSVDMVYSIDTYQMTQNIAVAAHLTNVRPPFVDPLILLVFKGVLLVGCGAMMVLSYRHAIRELEANRVLCQRIERTLQESPKWKRPGKHSMNSMTSGSLKSA